MFSQLKRFGLSYLVSFIDTEIVSSESSIGGTTSISKDGKTRPESAGEPGERNQLGLKKHGEIHRNQLRSRLQHLELELSSVLRTVRSYTDGILMEKVEIRSLVYK